MGQINQKTREGLEEVRRNSLFIDTDLHRLDGEHIQMLRDQGIDTESDSRREVQVRLEGEVGEIEIKHDFPELGTEGEIDLENPQESREQDLEDYGGISNFTQLKVAINNVIDEKQRNIENGTQEEK